MHNYKKGISLGSMFLIVFNIIFGLSAYFPNVANANRSQNNETGIFTIDFLSNEAGLSTGLNVTQNLAAGTIKNSGEMQSYIITSEVRPSSIANRNQLELSVSGQVSVDVIDCSDNIVNGLSSIIVSDSSNTINLTAIDVSVVKCLKVKINFTDTVSVLDNINVTRKPKNLILQDLSGPAEIRAGDCANYEFRRSSNYTTNQNVVNYVQLPFSGEADGIGFSNINHNYNQFPFSNPILNPNLSHLYTASGVTINDISIPKNSVYRVHTGVSYGEIYNDVFQICTDQGTQNNINMNMVGIIQGTEQNTPQATNQIITIIKSDTVAKILCTQSVDLSKIITTSTTRGTMVVNYAANIISNSNQDIFNPEFDIDFSQIITNLQTTCGVNNIGSAQSRIILETGFVRDTNNPTRAIWNTGSVPAIDSTIFSYNSNYFQQQSPQKIKINWSINYTNCDSTETNMDIPVKFNFDNSSVSCLLAAKTMPSFAFSGNVFRDLDRNGVYDNPSGEFMMSGVKVSISLNLGNNIFVTILNLDTDQFGTYNGQLPQGNYRITLSNYTGNLYVTNPVNLNFTMLSSHTYVGQHGLGILLYTPPPYGRVNKCMYTTTTDESILSSQASPFDNTTKHFDHDCLNSDNIFSGYNDDRTFIEQNFSGGISWISFNLQNQTFDINDTYADSFNIVRQNIVILERIPEEYEYLGYTILENNTYSKTSNISNSSTTGSKVFYFAGYTGLIQPDYSTGGFDGINLPATLGNGWSSQYSSGDQWVGMYFKCLNSNARPAGSGSACHNSPTNYSVRLFIKPKNVLPQPMGCGTAGLNTPLIHNTGYVYVNNQSQDGSNNTYPPRNNTAFETEVHQSSIITSNDPLNINQFSIYNPIIKINSNKIGNEVPLNSTINYSIVGGTNGQDRSSGNAIINLPEVGGICATISSIQLSGASGYTQSGCQLIVSLLTGNTFVINQPFSQYKATYTYSTTLNQIYFNGILGYETLISYSGNEVTRKTYEGSDLVGYNTTITSGNTVTLLDKINDGTVYQKTVTETSGNKIFISDYGGDPLVLFGYQITEIGVGFTGSTGFFVENGIITNNILSTKTITQIGDTTNDEFYQYNNLGNIINFNKFKKVTYMSGLSTVIDNYYSNNITNTRILRSRNVNQGNYYQTYYVDLQNSTSYLVDEYFDNGNTISGTGYYGSNVGYTYINRKDNQGRFIESIYQYYNLTNNAIFSVDMSLYFPGNIFAGGTYIPVSAGFTVNSFCNSYTSPSVFTYDSIKDVTTSELPTFPVKLFTTKYNTPTITTTTGSIDYLIAVGNEGQRSTNHTYIIDPLPLGVELVGVYTSGTHAFAGVNTGNYICTGCKIFFSSTESKIMSPATPFDFNDINNNFELGINNNGIWLPASIALNAVTHVAIQIDNTQFTLPTFAVNVFNTIGIRVKNVTNLPGDIISNSVAIFSDQTLQSISNKVETTIIANIPVLGSITGIVYFDVNQNSGFNNEPLLSGIIVSLYSNGELILQITTNASGGYIFTGLIADNYTIILTPPSGYIPYTSIGGFISGIIIGTGNLNGGSNPLIITNVQLGTGNHSKTNNFGLIAPSDLYIYKSSNGSYISGDIVTWLINYGNQGSGIANNVIINELPSTGFIYEGINPIWTGTLLAGQIGTLTITGRVYGYAGDLAYNNISISTTSIETNTGNNFSGSNVPLLGRLGSIAGKIYFDVNQNSGFDGEPLLSGVLVSLFDKNNILIGTTYTNNSGSYIFTGVMIGNYSVSYVLPSEYDSYTSSGGYIIENNKITGSGNLNGGNNPFIINNIVLGEGNNAINNNFGLIINLTVPPITTGNTNTGFIDLGLVKTASTSLAISGTIISYNLIITNYGPNNATGITITEIYPSGFTYISSSLSPSSGNNIFSIASLANSVSMQITITGKIVGILGQNILNTAYVYSSNLETGSQSNTGSANINIITSNPSMPGGSTYYPNTPYIFNDLPVVITPPNNNGVVITGTIIPIKDIILKSKSDAELPDSITMPETGVSKY